MRYSKLENELQLIMLLADSVGYTAIELSKLMNISLVKSTICSILLSRQALFF